MANPVHIPRPSEAEEERFWKKVEKRDNGCWEWIGGKFVAGYGMFSFRGKLRRAHRVLYVWTYGDLSLEHDGLDHICSNRACVNPAHMRPATAHENVLRGSGPTAVNARKTHCVNNHEFTAANTVYDAGGWRQCRTCINERAREYYQRHREAILAKARESVVRVVHEPRQCPECGLTFTPKRSDAVFCSQRCGQQVRNRRHADKVRGHVEHTDLRRADRP